jgi:hypothetical protein
VSSVALLVLSLMVLVPGLGAMMALYGPGEIGPATRLALVPALGYAVAGSSAFALMVLRALHPLSFLTLLSAVTVVLWLLALRRANPARQARAFAADVRADPWAIGIGLAVIAGMAVVALSFSPVLNFSPSSSWRYWADAKEIADAGRVPAHALQYGSLYPPTVSKGFLNAFNAGAILVLGSDPLRSLGALTWLGAVGFALSLWALGRELGLRLTAPLLPLLTVMNRLFLYKEISVDLHTYKAETFGRMCAFCAIAVGIRALRDRKSWRDAAVAGLLLGVAAGTHLVPVAVAVAMLAWYAIARMAADRTLVPILARGAAAAGVAVLLGLAILILPRGDIGFQGSGGNADYSRFGTGFDPTRYLSAGVVAPRTRPQGAFFIPPSHVYQAFVVRATDVQPTAERIELVHVLEFALAVGGLAVALFMLSRFPKELRAVGLTAWGLGASLVIAAMYFSYRYDLFVLAWFGVRRLFDYSALPLVLLDLALIEAGLWLLTRFRAWAPVAAGTALVAIFAAILIPTAPVPGSNVPADLARVAPIEWVRDNTPCDSRILVNQRTTGIFEAETGRVAVLEGMAPYLRPPILQPVVGLMLAARDFFQDPIAHAQFLQDQAIDYVVLIGRGTLGFQSLIGSPNAQALSSSPDLTVVHQDSAMTVYKVNRPTSSTLFPDPAGFPGYLCRTGPVGGT